MRQLDETMLDAVIGGSKPDGGDPGKRQRQETESRNEKQIEKMLDEEIDEIRDHMRRNGKEVPPRTRLPQK